MAINGLKPGLGPCAQPAGTAQITRRSLLGFIGATPTLLVAAAARAEPVRPKGSDPTILINEDPSDRKGLRYGGWVSWRADRIKAAGRPDQTVVHADVEVPDLAFKMTMDFSRNTDRSLPASHVVEITVKSSRAAARGSVVNVPGIMMKFAEYERGVPLVTRTAKITDGSFLIGFSDVNVDREHNLKLLKERAWFDIPMVYASQRRGILAINKGGRGKDIFRKAMHDWEKSL